MHDEIEGVVRDYLDGMIYVDEALLRRAFHADARSVGHYRGALEWESLDAFIAGCRAAGALPAGTPYYSKILAVETTGDIATVKLEDDYQGSRFTDYLTLMRFQEGWKIINKAFFNHG